MFLPGSILSSISWSAIFLFLVIGLLGLWVAYSFLNKNGLFLFAILAVMLSFFLPATNFFNYAVPMSAVFMPLVFFCFLVLYEKFGKLEARRLFVYILCELCTLCVCLFFVFAYIAAMGSGMGQALSWQMLGGFISQLISFVVVMFLSNFIVEKFPLKQHKYLRRSILGTIASVLNILIITFVGNAGVISFVDMLVIFAIGVVFAAGVSFAVCYLRKFLNREPIQKQEEQQEPEKADNEGETEPSGEEDTTDLQN